MEQNSSTSKRKKDEVFSSPDSITDYKRSCNYSDSSDSSYLCADLVNTNTTMSSPESNPSGDSEFLDRLVNTLKDPEVLTIIVKAVSECIAPVIKQEMSSLFKKQDKLEKDMKKLKATLEQRDKTITTLAEHLDRSEQYSRRNNVRIMGIPEEDGEDTNKLVLKLAATIGVVMVNEHIDISHRVPKYPPTRQETPRPIIVRFVSNSSLRSMLGGRRKLREHREETSNKKLFINEDLTRSRALLAKRARTLVAEKRAESTWVTGGVILIKLYGGSVKKVANETHFDEVCELVKSKMIINLSEDEEEEK